MEKHLSKYVTIRQIVDALLSERHLINLVVDRSGASITDTDVIKLVEDFITRQSRTFDGYLRGYCKTPILPRTTGLTGELTMTPGSRIVTGVGTEFTNELQVNDEIRLDAETWARVHVASIQDDENLTTHFVYYGAGIQGSASVYDSRIPDEVSVPLAGHIAWVVWQRRGRYEGDNPFEAENRQYLQLVRDIQNGRYRFESPEKREVSQKPTRTHRSNAVMTDSRLEDFIP